MTDAPPKPRRDIPLLAGLMPPLAPLVTSVALLALYAAFAFATFREQKAALYDFALAPQRFWAPAGTSDVYPDMASGLLTLVSVALLHDGWMHVAGNALLILAFGTPVARALGRGPLAWGSWMLLFVGSVAAGSALYLAFATVGSDYVAGASGGVSGLVAASFLLDGWGLKRKLWSSRFLLLTGAFVLANVLLYFLAPFGLGFRMAWEAHAGGYIAGALLMALLPVRGYQQQES